MPRTSMPVVDSDAALAYAKQLLEMFPKLGAVHLVREHESGSFLAYQGDSAWAMFNQMHGERYEIVASISRTTDQDWVFMMLTGVMPYRVLAGGQEQQYANLSDTFHALRGYVEGWMEQRPPLLN